MADSTYRSIQLDANGDEIVNTDVSDSRGGTVQTKADYDAIGNPTGAQIVDVGALNATLKQTSDGLNAEAKFEGGLQALEGNQNQIMEKIDFYQTLAASGREVPPAEIEALVHNMNSVISQFGSLGGQITDESIIGFRAFVQQQTNSFLDSNARRKR